MSAIPSAPPLSDEFEQLNIDSNTGESVLSPVRSSGTMACRIESKGWGYRTSQPNCAHMWLNLLVTHSQSDAASSYMLGLLASTVAPMHTAGADPGIWERGGLINIFTTGEGTGGGVPPPVTAKGVWSFAPAAFLLLHLFSMKLTVISIHAYTCTSVMRIWITGACMDSDEKTLHSSQCYIVPTAQQLNS